MTGMTVLLETKTITGYDELYDPIYDTEWVEVQDCLVAPSSTDDIATATDLYSKKASYTIGLPKGDDHDWQDKDVKFFGLRAHTIGIPLEGIEANVPTRWHKKVLCEVIE